MPTRVPHEFQRRGVEWLVSHGGAGVFATPGAGKTAITLRALLALKQAKVMRRTLIVAPIRPMYKVWPVEPAEWAGTEWDGLQALRMRILHGKNKDFEATQDADIFLINFHGLKWLFEDGLFTRFKKMGIDTLIIDESTAFKNSRTRRFKMLKQVLPKFARRWILTGTPAPNGLMNIFPQCYIIDLGKALGKYITHYRLKYFLPLDRQGWAWSLKPGAEKEIQNAIAPYIFNLEPGDYAEIPIYQNVVRVDLPPEAMKVYSELEEEMITKLMNGVVTAANAGAASMKCTQIANGGIYFTEFNEEHGPASILKGKRKWENLHEAKTEAVEEIVNELNGSPCLVVYDFKHDLDRLQKKFPNAPFIGGGVSAKESGKLIDDWNADKIEVLLVNAQSVSHGLNLQLGSAQNIIWHSITWDLEIFEQLNARLARQGTKHDQIFVHLIVARNTTDESRLRALRSKDKTQRGFLAALKEYAAERTKLTVASDSKPRRKRT